MDEPTRESHLGKLRIDRSAERKRSVLRRRVLPILALLAVIGAVLAYVLTRPTKVSVAEVRAARPGERVTELTASGYVASRRRSIVAPKIPGRLVEVLVEEGEQVKEGQELARLDDEEERVALVRAKAAADTARARLGRARVMVIQTRRELERTQRLAESGALSPAALDEAETASDASLAEREAATADLATARAAIEAAQLRLDQTVVRAPFAGTVVRKLADEGAVLAPAAISELEVGGIVELVDLDALEVEAEVSEDRLAEIEEGQPALVFLDAYPDDVFPAVTGTVRPAVDRSKATAVVKVVFDEIPEGALPDMGAKVAFLTRPIPEAELADEPRLRVPAAALAQRDGRTVIFTVEDGRARPAPVEVADRVGPDAVLETGPPPGTKVAITTDTELRAGQRVRVETGAP